METNSITSKLTKETAISLVKLSLGADIEKKNVHLIVEGQDDVKILKKFCEANTIILESYSGKEGVEAVVTSKVINDNRVIGIRDKDYCSETSNNRIFFYDKCCLEMMMLNFEEIFENIYHEFYEGKLDSKQLKKSIFEELYKVSMVRKYNEEKKAGIKFTGIKFSKLINKNGELELITFIRELEKTNPEKEFSYIKETVKTEIESGTDYFDITNGHDFLSFFKVLCDKTRKGKACIGTNEIQSSVRTSFNKSHFRETKLYQHTSEYCHINAFKIWGF